MFILKGLVKKPLVSALCLLLTVASAALWVLGTAMGEAGQVRVLQNEPLRLAVTKREAEEKIDLNSLNWIEIPTKALAESFEMDIRTYGAAYSEGLIPAHAAVPEKYGIARSPAALVICIGTCTDVEQTYTERTQYYTTVYTFEVNETVYQNEANKVEPKTFQYNDSSKLSTLYFEKGKQYLVWGYCSEDVEGKFNFPVNRLGKTMVTVAQAGTHWIVEMPAGTKNYVPILSEIDQPVEDFLKTEVGQVWQRAIFAKIEICENTLGIMGTDCLQSIPAWNTEDCVLTEGEVFTAEQYENGERVCLISEEVASLNGLTVGDSLPLKLFATSGTYEPDTGIQYQDTFDPYAGFDAEGEWRIIGIYASDYDKEPGDYDIHPNMILVPKRSVACFSEWSAARTFDYIPGDLPPSAYSVILSEEEWEDFELVVEGLGYVGWFEYNNGMTPEKEAQQKALGAWQEKTAKSAKTLFKISVVLMAAAMMIHAFSRGKEIGQIYAIETSYSRLFFHIFAQALAVGTVAFALSAAIAVCGVPPLARAVLSRAADPAYAEIWLSKTVMEPRALTDALALPALILVGTAILFGVIECRRDFHFEYHEKSEK